MLKPVFPIEHTIAHSAVQCKHTPQPAAFPLKNSGAHLHSSSEENACISYGKQYWRKYGLNKKADFFQFERCSRTRADSPNLFHTEPGQPNAMQ